MSPKTSTTGSFVSREKDEVYRTMDSFKIRRKLGVYFEVKGSLRGGPEGVLLRQTETNRKDTVRSPK